MAAQSSRYFRFAPARRSRPAQSFRLRCEPLEGRIAPALFNVQSPMSFTGLSNNGCVAVADLNNDTHMDAVLANFGTDYGTGAGSTITVLYGREGGGFNRVNLSTSGRNISFVTIADINGDNFPDVLASNANQQTSQGSISVFRNNAGALALVGTPFSTFSYNPAWVGLADVTGDNVLDAVVASFGRDDGTGENIEGNNVTIFQGNGDFTFQASPVTTLFPEIQFIPTAAAVADFDGDGTQDIAATVPGVPLEFGQPQPEGSVYLFKGTGGGGFANPNQLGTGGALPINIQAAYLDGDAKLDLVVANAGDPNASPEFKDDAVGVLLNASSPGSLSFGVVNSLTTNTYGPFATAIADFDLDGSADIASVNYGSQALSPEAFISFYKGNGTGGFAPGPSPATFNTQTGLGGGQYLAAGDFDANGTPDLVVAHATSVVGMLINTSTPQQTAATTTNLASSGSPSTVGQSVTFTATVSSTGGTVTGGTVQFFDNGSPIGGPVSLTGQQAQKSTSGLTAGTHTITATYSGAAGFAGSNSNPVSQVVNAAATGPTVTINQGGSQADPTNVASVAFTVQFSESVTGFDASDIAFTGSTVGGTLVPAISGSGQDYTVTITGMTGTGTVVASVKPNGAVNGTGTGNQASTSNDNTVTFDGVRPTVTINQANGQTDPTTGSQIKFDVVFSESVTGFTAGDVILSGTAGGNLVPTISGSGTTYEVTVTGMTSTGTVIAAIGDGAATDGVGNTSQASTSTDNTVTFTSTSVLGFKDVRYNTAEPDAPATATITLTRTGPAGGQVSVDFQTADGTANSVVGSFNPADYVTTTGTVTWADGEGGDKTFTVTIQPDSLNEGKELVNLLLSNPQGSASLGLATATLAIAPSDGTVVVATDRRPFARFVDTDGDTATVRLGGRLGTATVYRTDPDGDGRGPIEWIEVANTLPDPLRPRSVLTVGVTKGRFSVDGGTVNVGAITGSGLRAINARRANLNLEGINLNGYLGSLVIGNVVNGADITTGANPDPLRKTRLNALVIGDGTDINVGAHVSSLTAASFGVGSFRAPSAGAIIVRGTLAADVTLSGFGVDPNRYTLGALRVRGTVTGSDIRVNGHVRAVTVGAFRDSRLFAGYNGPDVPTPGGFTSPALVGSFRTTSTFDAFQDSYVIATAFRSVSLSSLDSTNDGTKFGFYADTSLGSVKVRGLLPFSYNATLPTPQGTGDFEVRIV